MVGWLPGFLTNRSDPVQAAIVAAVTAAVTLVAKEIFSRLNDRRRRRDSSLLVYQRYADPLVAATVPLLWRLREIFGDGRAHYLVGSGPKPAFDVYKARSTLYRLAAVLGWLRAIDREMSLLRLPDHKAAERLHAAIGAFREALSNGVGVEAQRLSILFDFAGVALDQVGDRSRLGAELDQMIDHACFDANVQSADALPADAQIQLMQVLEQWMQEKCELQVPVKLHPPDQLARSLTIRESWLYFDWQAGVGDTVIRNISFGERKFEVAGYAEFEAMIESGDHEQRRWILRLYSLIEDLDINSNVDARAGQLRATYQACATLISALIDVPGADVYVNAATKGLVASLTT